MDSAARFEADLRKAIRARLGNGSPAGLAAAVEYALFPGGHRIRPKISMAVSRACGMDEPRVAFAAAAAIELLHCASLVHDDMPCFDNAALRRGKPSVHTEFGEALALLTGDALIILAYQVLADEAALRPSRFHALMQIVNASVGLPRGIVAGQAFECESDVDLETYHRAKTGALFAAASMAGAAAAGVEHADWEHMGSCLGEAYQVADDLLDIYGDPEFIGKPVGRDGDNNRPNVVNGLGLEAATAKLNSLIAMVEDSVPDCDGREELQALIEVESRAFVDIALGRQEAA